MSYGEFISTLEMDTGLFPEKQSIAAVKSGFPPRPLSLTDNQVIKDHIKNGDQLVLETVPASAKSTDDDSGVPNTVPETLDSIPSVYLPEEQAYMILRNIADDNSCMFNAINYAMKRETVAELRSVVATYIESDPEKYNEAILGRTNHDYSLWIRKKDSWGGAIELGILSDYYRIQINCVDIELGQTIKFETNSQTDQFMVLIYSGIHYDILSLNKKLSTEDSDKLHDICVFSTNPEQYHTISSGSDKMCKLLQTKDYSTNLTKFRIRCLECYTVCVGETGASKHANETGHFRFGEVK